MARNKISEILIKNKSNKGKNNPAALEINIFDANNNIIYECNGNFFKICKDNNLPCKALMNSYKNNGYPIYSKMKSDRFKKYKGWYAKMI